jgi:hypothetical protein
MGELPQVKHIATSAAAAAGGSAGGPAVVSSTAAAGPGASPLALSTSSPFHAQSHIGAFPGAAGVAGAGGGGGGGGKKKFSFAQLQNDVIYGLINAIVGIPTMISFAAIVYQVRGGA